MIASGIAPERAELIRGVIIQKMSKSILHFKLTHLLAELFRTALGERFWVRQEAPLTLADSEPEPDISIVSGRLEDYRDHPATALLVVEVSVSTLAEDRAMAEIYAEAGVEEFWLVNAAQRRLEIHRTPVRGEYRERLLVEEGQTAQCLAIPGLQVDVADLFSRAAGLS